MQGSFMESIRASGHRRSASFNGAILVPTSPLMAVSRSPGERIKGFFNGRSPFGQRAGRLSE
jgi:hypothetical protein